MSTLRRLAFLTLIVSLVALPGSAALALSKVIYSGNGDCRDIALTYDTEFGSSTQALADTIDELGIRTTWFFLGDSVDAYPALVRQVASRHQVGSHVYSHPEMPKLSVAEMHRQFSLAEDRISAVAGADPQPFWRPPYGEYNNTVLQVAEEEGYPYTVMWSVDTRDWAGPSSETIRQRIVQGAFPGAIVLQHGSPPNTVQGTRLAVGDLRARGYQFVTVAEILGFGRDQRDFGGDSYVVQSGDTWAFAAVCHNLSSARLQAYNDGTALTPGAVLQIPHLLEVIIRIDLEPVAFPVYPRITEGRAVAHVRLAERLGATVSWDGARAIISKGARRIEITPGERIALVDGVPVDMGAAAFWEGDRILVPVRFVAGQLGASVSWTESTFVVDIFR